MRYHSNTSVCFDDSSTESEAGSSSHDKENPIPQPTPPPDESSETTDSDSTGSGYQCSICGNTGGRWIGCDLWFHLKCVGVKSVMLTGTVVIVIARLTLL